MVCGIGLLAQAASRVYLCVKTKCIRFECKFSGKEDNICIIVLLRSERLSCNALRIPTVVLKLTNIM